MSYDIQHTVNPERKKVTRKMLEMDMAVYQRELEKAQTNMAFYTQKIEETKAALAGFPQPI